MLINKRLWALARPHQAQLAWLTVLLGTATISYWVQAWFLAVALAGLLPGSGVPKHEIAVALLAVLGCGLVRAGLNQAYARLANSLGAAVRTSLRSSLAATLLHPERLRDGARRKGAQRLALSEGVDGVEPYLTAYIPHALQLQVLTPIVLIAISLLNPVLGAVLLVAVLVAVALPRLWGRMLSRRSSTHWDSYEALSADFLEALQGMRSLKIMHAVARFRIRLEQRSDALHRATVRAMRVSLADTALADLGIQAGLLAAAALTCLEVLGALPSGWGAGSALTFFTLMLASELFRPVRDLARQWHAGYLGLSALGSIDQAAGEVPLQASGQAAAAGTERKRPMRPGRQPVRELRLEQVGFRYAGDGPMILQDLEISFRRGQLTALTGPSGAGKSTLFDILLGFLPARGECVLDGIPLAPGDASVVSQRSYVFPGTIRDNLLTVAPQASEAQMEAVLERAGLGSELESWPEGLDTRVAESGQSLSGGQLQRLSIARALLSDRPVMLLDEPTSALNPALAAKLMDTLRSEARRRIVVMTAHRPEAIKVADRVLHLENGSIREITPALQLEKP